DTGWYSQYSQAGDPNAYVYFQFVYPRPEVVTTEQQEYLKAYVDSFEFAINAPSYEFGGKRYDEFIDLQSFVDNFIMNEVTKNVDAYRLSSYYSKDKNGKIIAGPLWDFNLSMGNADYCDGADDNEWNFQVCGTMGPKWWPRMWEDQVFRDLLKCRWDFLRQNVFHIDSLMARIDDMAAQLNAAGAVDRNFMRWPVLGVYVWPNTWPYANSHEEAVEQLKTWFTNRINWMDQNITGDPLCIAYVDNESVNTEYFEGDFEPNCWTTLDEDGDGFSWQGVAPVGGYESVHSAFSYSFESDDINYDPDNYLVLPHLIPAEGEHLTWYASRQAGGDSEHYQVLLSTTGNTADDFDVVLWEETLTSTDFVYRASDLTAWWGQEIYIAFRHFDSAGNMMLRIDEIKYPTLVNPDQDCSVGLSEADAYSFEVWPTPCDAILNVSTEAGNHELWLSDITGRRVNHFNFQGTQLTIPTNELPSGVYMITLDGESRRVVVE
ncbi:MAG: CotH kinase family protein, partial [Flavobacteriales bacterium]|nr:CotH kinase family protein [Flavobacteriales bacterium]